MGSEKDERERNSFHGRRYEIRVRACLAARVLNVPSSAAEMWVAANGEDVAEVAAAAEVVGIVP